MADPTPEESIRQNIAEPKSAAADGVSASNHSIRDQIEGDRYLASKEAARRGRTGIRQHKLRSGPPGGE